VEEKEQLDDIRAWWSQYGNYVLSGVAVGALSLFGWSYYKSTTADNEIAASVLYDELATHVADGDLDDAERVAGVLSTEHGSSLYALQSKLALARLYMDNSRDKEAADALKAIVDSRQSAELSAVARIRLAKVLQYQEKYEEVLTLLDGEDSTGFTARYAEARGDALVALSRFDEAREAYLVALADNGQTLDATFLQLKLLDLPPAEPEVLDSGEAGTAEPVTETAEAGETDAEPAPDADSGEEASADQQEETPAEGAE